MVDYEPPTLCIRSLVEYKPGYYHIDMPSVYDISLEPYILEIDQDTLDSILIRWEVPMCPPGWPDPPVEE